MTCNLSPSLLAIGRQHPLTGVRTPQRPSFETPMPTDLIKGIDQLGKVLVPSPGLNLQVSPGSPGLSRL